MAVQLANSVFGEFLEQLGSVVKKQQREDGNLSGRNDSPHNLDLLSQA